MGGSVPTLLQATAVTASCIADRSRHSLTFSISSGCKLKNSLLILQQLMIFASISNVFTIGSCSDDGSVVLINNLFTEERFKFEYHRSMKAIALDPEYMRKASRGFVTGGLAGHLYYNKKKWIGYRNQVLHSGEGPIHSVKWRNNLIAWVNDTGVKVYDAANDRLLTFIERPRGSPRPELLLPHLVWQDDNLLVIGWGTSIKIISIRNNQNRGANVTYNHLQLSILNKVDVVASFQTSYYISGIAPFGDSLVVLAYIPVEEDREKDFSSAAPSRQAHEICVRRGLFKEQVFILGRMGNAKQALTVIINKLGDIEEAIEFVSNQHDDDLWEELIKQCMNKPDMVGVLLENTVGNLDPLYWRYLGCDTV